MIVLLLLLLLILLVVVVMVFDQIDKNETDDGQHSIFVVVEFIRFHIQSQQQQQ